MSVHSRIDKTLDELLDMPSVINYLGKNITFPKLVVAQARINGKVEGMEQGSLEMVKLARERLIPDLEARVDESLKSINEGFITSLGKYNMEGVLLRDKITGLPIKIHQTIKEIFPDEGNALYYFRTNLLEGSDLHGKTIDQPDLTWSASADRSVNPDMTQEKWERSNELFPRYKTGELKTTKIRRKLLSKTNNLPVQNILQDMMSKKLFHVNDWNIPDREFIARLKSLPAPLP